MGFGKVLILTLLHVYKQLMTQRMLAKLNLRFAVAIAVSGGKNCYKSDP